MQSYRLLCIDNLTYILWVPTVNLKYETETHRFNIKLTTNLINTHFTLYFAEYDTEKQTRKFPVWDHAVLLTVLGGCILRMRY